MRKYLELIGLVLAIINGLAELIKAFEVPGWGKEKKNIVIELAKNLFEVVRMKFKVDIVWDDIAGLVDKAIDVIVNFYNAVGIFKKGEGGPT